MEAGQQYCVYIDYSEIDTEGNSKSLSKEDVNNYYEEKEKEKLGERVSNLFGIENVKVAAKSQTDVETSDSGMLKQVLTLTQTKTGGNILVYYAATWLEDPYYRSTDAAMVQFKNATPIKNSGSCYYEYRFRRKDIPWQESYIVADGVNLSDDMVYELNGVIVEYDLVGSKLLGIEGENILEHMYDKVYMYCYVTVDNKQSWKYIVAKGDYWHQVSSLRLNPSFSVAADGFSFSISPQYEKSYHRILDSTYITFNFK